MSETTHKHSNRLAQEKSPYLLQHAHNPVGWYPWGQEAFDKARAEDKPIFLSIGYSTCHWCHVMEEESFEDDATAAYLNAHFVPIKVDREERPNVDQIYMTSVMAMTGSGGWPLSVFLTADLKPFYGGTYFPKEARWGMPSFLQVLEHIHQSWGSNRPALLSAGDNLARAIRDQAKQGGIPAQAMDTRILSRAAENILAGFDEEHGGFGPAPKFPRSHLISFLLRQWKRSGDAQTLRMVRATLDAMADGGMYDQVGGGFHRYSVDERWHVPHFEKMLYDQALLLRSYLEAYQITGNARYAAVARDILEYVSREMTSPEGGWYCAQDADSADPADPKTKREGAFYVWEASEIENILGAQDAKLFAAAYGAEKHGNVQSDPHGEFPNKNVLFRAQGDAALAETFAISEEDVRNKLESAREKLFKERAKRPAPHLDDKILTDWNGLYLSSIAYAYQVLGDEKYRQAGEKAAGFMRDTLVRGDGRLLHRYRDGDAAILGTLEDHAFLVHGLFDLFEATQETRYLAEARHWAKEMLRLFWDKENGGFYASAGDAKHLIARTKDLYDGAIPSGNSVAALGLLRVARLTMDKELEAKATRLFESFSGQINQSPAGFPQLLIALDFTLGPTQEIVIAGDADASATRAMLREVFRRFLPNKVVALHPTEGAEAIEKLIPFLKSQTPRDGKPTAYVCTNYACKEPVTDIKKLTALLE